MTKSTFVISRRRLVTRAAAAGMATIAPLIRTGPARAAKHTLRILQWNHFVPGFDRWFNGTYIRQWGEKNDTEVIVDNVGVGALPSRAAAEVSAQKGHDLFLFLTPPPVYEDQVIDHREIYEECSRRHGKPIDLAMKSTFNPKTRKYFGFSDSYTPDPVNYRADLWNGIGMKPDSWDDILVGGRKIRQATGIPVGLGLSAELDTSMALRSLMHSFGASEQDADGNLVLNSPATLDALNYVKTLFQECMTPEVLAWDPSSNNRAMLAGRSSLVLNSVAITREGENKAMPIHEKILLAPPPMGPVRRIALEHVMNSYVVWKFAENIDGAKRFLVDYVDNFRDAFVASEYYNVPCFPGTVPDLKDLTGKDAKANPTDKYAVLNDSVAWTVNVGYPGYSNAAIDELYNTWVLNTMFAKVANGAETPEAALRQADAQAQRIWAKWKDKGAI